MATQHSAITEANLHENKGVSTAAVDKVAVSDGAGATVWQKLSPKSLAGLSTNGVNNQNVEVDGAGNFRFHTPAYGWIYFENIGAPYTLTYPATYTKLAPTTTVSGLGSNVTEATTAKLTYIGAGEVMDVLAPISIDQAVGANRDLQFAIYKNGVAIPGSTTIVTTTSAEKVYLALTAVVSLATNDYVEVYAKNNGGSGDIRVYCFSLSIDPH